MKLMLSYYLNVALASCSKQIYDRQHNADTCMLRGYLSF
jgi:hypothetical protein